MITNSEISWKNKLHESIVEYCKIYGAEKTIKQFQQLIIDLNDPSLATAFAQHIPGADINSLEKVVLDKKNGLASYQFVKYVAGSDIEAHRQIVLESEVLLKRMYASIINRYGKCLDPDTCEIVDEDYYAIACIFFKNINELYKTVVNEDDIKDIFKKIKCLLTNKEEKLNIIDALKNRDIIKEIVENMPDVHNCNQKKKKK